MIEIIFKQLRNLDISEGEKVNAKLEGSTSNEITKFVRMKKDDSSASNSESSEEEISCHALGSNELISEKYSHSEEKNIEIQESYQSIDESEALEQTQGVSEHEETKSLLPESYDSSTHAISELKQDLDETKEEKPLVNENTKNDSGRSQNQESCINSTKTILVSSPLDYRLLLLYMHRTTFHKIPVSKLT